jgi:predicted small secreted protein
MRRTLLLLASVSMMSFAVAAHATTIGPGTYNLEDANVAGHTVTGTVTLNSAGYITAADLSFSDPDYSSTPIAFNSIGNALVYTGIGQDDILAPNNGGQIALYFNLNSDSNGKFDLCLHNGSCGNSGGSGDSTLQTYGYSVDGPPWYVGGFGPDDFTSGYLSATSPGKPSVSQTPEPSSLMLLGTGILGFTGAIRRRVFKS